MKGYKALMPFAMIGVVLLSVYMLYSSRITKVNEYNDAVANARSYASQGIVVDALAEYARAAEINDNIDLQVEIGEFFLQMGDVSSAVDWGETMVEQFPKDAKSYEFLLSRYRSLNDYSECYSLYNTVVKREIVSDIIESIMSEIKYEFYYGDAVEDLKAFCNGYCQVLRDGKWGYVNQRGGTAISCKFAEAGAFINGVAPVVTETGDAYFIDAEGNKKVVVQNAEVIKGLTSMAGGCFAVYDGTVWTFYDTTFNPLSTGYSAVSIKQGSVVAAEKDGYWYLLNESFESVDGKKYEDIVQNEIGIAYSNGRLFVKENEFYYMVDKDGRRISDAKYKSARLFNDGTYAAVETENGWTFIDAEGNEVFENTYFEDARSFSYGYAAVKRDGAWGFISTDGQTVINYQFEDARDFNSSGCVFIRADDAWRMILLYSQNYQ